MTVERMIKELKKMNPKAEVRSGYYNGETLLFVVSRANDDSVVWLESESDIDLGSELEARFDYAAENQIDELDFYMELLDIGITVDMVRKYMGEEVAEHMKLFCEEHGLI